MRVRMETRLKFLPGIQEQFLAEVERKTGLSTAVLAYLAGIVPRSYRDWRGGKLNMTLKAAKLFCDKFGVTLPEGREVLIARWRESKKEANRIGGIACFKKHGSPGMPEGRRKGGRRAMAILHKRGLAVVRKEFRLPKGYNSDLAEFVGILLGDGGLSISQCSITLNGEADRQYINYVISLGIKLFEEKPGFFERKKSKAVVIYYSGINLVNYLVKIGLKVGNKVKQQVSVPDWIFTSRDYKIACLRGLMDTDGGVFLHKYKVNGKMYKYKKICFSNRSMPLLWFVSCTLQELGLTPKTITKVENKKVWLYNENEVKQYLDLVGTHNSRLLKY